VVGKGEGREDGIHVGARVGSFEGENEG